MVLVTRQGRFGGPLSVIEIASHDLDIPLAFPWEQGEHTHVGM